MGERANDEAANGHLTEQTVDRFVRGALTGAPRAAVEAHLTGCASCVELVGLAVGASEGTLEAPSDATSEGPSGDTRRLPPPPVVARPAQVLATGAVLGRYT